MEIVMNWIKCSDRLPEDDKTVLAYIKNEGIYFGNFSIKGFSDDTFGFYAATTGSSEWFYDIDLITHWMPLPEKPNEI